MALMDSLFQQLSTVQDGSQPLTKTVTAAATITPTGFLTVLTGNTAVGTINPPVSGMHLLAIMPGTTTGFTTSGNIVGGTTTVASRAYLFVYNPLASAAYTTGGHYLLVSSTTS
jgi:hypothetical protein